MKHREKISKRQLDAMTDDEKQARVGMTDEDVRNASIKLSAAFLLYTKAQSLTDEVADLLSRYALNLGRTKYFYKNLTAAFNMFELETRAFFRGFDEFAVDSEKFESLVEAFLFDNEKDGNWNWEQRYYFAQMQLKQRERKINELESKIKQYENEN